MAKKGGLRQMGKPAEGIMLLVAQGHSVYKIENPVRWHTRGVAEIDGSAQKVDINVLNRLVKLGYLTSVKVGCGSETKLKYFLTEKGREYIREKAN